MNRKYLVFMLTIVTNFALAQQSSFDWTKQAGGLMDDRGYSVATDNLNNVYVTGHFSWSAVFGNDTLISTMSREIFITKYNNVGDIIWAKQAGGSESEISNSITIDNSNNIYITGYFKETAYFDNEILTSEGEGDIFIAKYDTSGNLIWVKQIGSYGHDAGVSLATDIDDNIYITGDYEGNVNFDNVTLYGDYNATNIFVTKYSNNGELFWVKSAGSNSNDHVESITIDSEQNILITGSFLNQIFFDDESLISNGMRDIFIAKYNNSGNLIWLKQAGGTWNDEGYSVACDNNNNVLITGYISGEAFFENETLISYGDDDIIIAKYKSDGDLFWVKQIGGIYQDRGYSLFSDKFNNHYITGYFSGTIYFDNDSITIEIKDNIFVGKFNSTGNIIWLKYPEEGGNANEGKSINSDNNGNVFITGFFSGSTIFDNDTLESFGDRDIFVTKIRDSTFNYIKNATHKFNINIYPNPTKGNLKISLENDRNNDYVVDIYDITGKKISANNYETNELIIDMNHFERGIYILTIKNKIEKIIWSEKIIKK